MERKQNKLGKILSSQHIVVFIIVVLAVAAMAIYSAVLTSVLSESVLQNEIAENTQRTDAMYESMQNFIQEESFTQVNSQADKSSVAYGALQTHMNEIRNMNSTRYFYTAKRADDGTLVYLVDGLDQNASDFRNPGDAIEEEMIPYIERALAGENVYSNDIVDTDWGHIFTACYPVKNSSGDIIGALCIETDMEATYAFIQQHQNTLVSAAATACLLLVVAILLVYTFVRRYQKLDETDRKIIAESNKQLEDALAREKKHSEIVSAMATIYTTIFLIDMQTHDYEVIESVELMHGVAGKAGNIDTAIEGILNAFITPDMRNDMRAFLDLNTLQERMAHANTLMTEYRNPDGRWFQARFIVKRRDASGKLTAVLYCARDFTDEKQRELELQDRILESATEAKRANLSKTNFLRRMSHDIRTPLNGIIGMINLADRYQNDPEKLRECKQKINSSADYLLDLVNNVLDISKLESGALELEEKPFDLGEMLMKNISVVQTNATENGVVFHGGKDASKLVHRHVIGSPTHLNRLLMNIASNAVKYNKTGGSVTMYVNEIASDANTATYEFVCSDTGLGMSEEFQKHAFEPFTQEGKQTTTTFTGSGLGLSIVKDLVDLMGGTMVLESQENVGTTFNITLTFALDHEGAAAEQNAVEKPKLNLSGQRALLVEDNELNREIARIMLEDLGLSVEEAHDGKQAVEAFLASQPHHFNYIFMDVMMPVMDGMDATRAIRSLSRPDAASVPIIAMTANAFAEDRKACLDAGMNAHVGKPIDVKTVAEAITSLEG